MRAHVGVLRYNKVKSTNLSPTKMLPGMQNRDLDEVLAEQECKMEVLLESHEMFVRVTRNPDTQVFHFTASDTQRGTVYERILDETQV